MGWLFKGLVLVVGLFSLTLGFWPLWAPCFGYLAYSLWSATRRRNVYVKDRTGGAAQPPRPKKPRLFKRRYLLAGVFFVLGAAAHGDRGTYSPYVFISLGVAIVLSGVPRITQRMSALKPVPDSILLRSRWFPISWVSLVEVKFGTPQMSRALSSVGCEVLLTTDSERISVYLPLRVLALSAPQANRRVVERLAPLARQLSPKGAFVFPLDAKEAAARITWSLESVDLALEYGRNGVVSLNSTPFDILVIKPDGHLVERAAGYAKLGGSKQGGPALPSPGRKLGSQPLVWEALEVLGEKFQVKEADPCTSFLSSVCATKGEGVGDRLVNEGRDGTATVMVSSLGAGQVELTRPQLRAIVRAYG
jgi:hypothetical protein